jgi:hypothetical protein
MYFELCPNRAFSLSAAPISSATPVNRDLRLYLFQRQLLTHIIYVNLPEIGSIKLKKGEPLLLTNLLDHNA